MDPELVLLPDVLGHCSTAVTTSEAQQQFVHELTDAMFHQAYDDSSWMSNLPCSKPESSPINKRLLSFLKDPQAWTALIGTAYAMHHDAEEVMVPPLST